MTTGIYSGISAADLGHEPDAPTADCPACGDPVYWATWPATGLICSGCLREYSDRAELDRAEAYYRQLWDEMNGDDDQRDEDASGYADTVAAGLERWTR